MAPGLGPVIRMLAQAAIPIFRAFATAYQQALQNARKDGANAAKEALKPRKAMMTNSEAVQILNMAEADAQNMAVITERYNKLFEVNDPKNGGSFYLQSKVYRAHEALVNDMKKTAAEAAESSTKTPPP